MSASTTASAPFADTTRKLIVSHALNLGHEIDSFLYKERKVLAYTLARIAVAQHAAPTQVMIADLNVIDTVACNVDGHQRDLPIDPAIAAVLIPVLQRLPAGDAAPWNRRGDAVELDVSDALTYNDLYPFRQVQDRIVEYIEEKTGRSVRRVEITSDLWDNGYFYVDTVEVDYSDGDSDEIYIEDMSDFSEDLRQELDDPGPNTVVTIVRTNSGITIR